MYVDSMSNWLRKCWRESKLWHKSNYRVLFLGQQSEKTDTGEFNLNPSPEFARW